MLSRSENPYGKTADQPGDQKDFRQLPMCDAKQREQAIAAVRCSLPTRPRLGPREREGVLLALANTITLRATQEQSKPLAQARGEIRSDVERPR
jgi:acyl-CoA reductase-like NAD-dependent aldehyde dehydrogenase